MLFTKVMRNGLRNAACVVAMALLGAPPTPAQEPPALADLDSATISRIVGAWAKASGDVTVPPTSAAWQGALARCDLSLDIYGGDTTILYDLVGGPEAAKGDIVIVDSAGTLALIERGDYALRIYRVDGKQSTGEAGVGVHFVEAAQVSNGDWRSPSVPGLPWGDWVIGEADVAGAVRDIAVVRSRSGAGDGMYLKCPA